MGLINKIKEYRRTRMFEKCFSKQKWAGHTFMNICEGKDAVEWGLLDGFELYCLNCPHFIVELKAEVYKEGLLKRRKENEFMTKHIGEPVKCPYCQEGHALVEGKTNDTGIAIQYPNRLIAYGYDIHGPGSNGLSVRIDYCPMCGRKL